MNSAALKLKDGAVVYYVPVDLPDGGSGIGLEIAEPGTPEYEEWNPEAHARADAATEAWASKQPRPHRTK